MLHLKRLAPQRTFVQDSGGARIGRIILPEIQIFIFLDNSVCVRCFNGNNRDIAVDEFGIVKFYAIFTYFQNLIGRLKYLKESIDRRDKA
jgi:hypothetical protein